VKPIASAIIFMTCIAWIAASAVLGGHAGHELASWDWLAVVGAMISFLSAVD
jgi:hypothetical protein